MTRRAETRRSPPGERGTGLKRRRLGALLGASIGTAGWAAPSRAQRPKPPVIAYLSGRSLATDDHLLAAVRDGLREEGYAEGDGYRFDFSWANGDFSALERLAREVVDRKPDLVMAVGGTPVPIAVHKVTTTLPVVFTFGADPVTFGLVKSYGKPGGNMTGSVLLATTLEGKRLDLMHEMVPAARTIALMANPTSAFYGELERDARATATARGLALRMMPVANPAEIDRAFDAMAGDRPDGLVVSIDSLLIGQRERILARTAAIRLPAIYPAREFTDAGGLASYSARWTDMYRWAGVYAGRILKGARPADLPVQQPTVYELVVNARTARALGLALPVTLLTRADEVLE